jgi:hypothetical protein
MTRLLPILLVALLFGSLAHADCVYAAPPGSLKVTSSSPNCSVYKIEWDGGEIDDPTNLSTFLTKFSDDTPVRYRCGRNVVTATVTLRTAKLFNYESGTITTPVEWKVYYINSKYHQYLLYIESTYADIHATERLCRAMPKVIAREASDLYQCRSGSVRAMATWDSNSDQDKRDPPFATCQLNIETAIKRIMIMNASNCYQKSGEINPHAWDGLLHMLGILG